MSSLRAIELPTQRLELHAVETEAFPHALATRGIAPWKLAAEEWIRIVARLGFSPTPTILLVSGLIVAASFHAR